MNFPHISLCRFLFLLHLLFSSFTQTLITIPICPKTTQVFHAFHTHAPAPTVLGVPVQHCSGGCAAPILITLGEHTCENRCPPGLACCSSLGWSVCVWLSQPLLRPPSQSPCTEFLRSPAGRPGPRTQTGKANGGMRQGGRKHWSPGFYPPALFVLILDLFTDDNEKV